MATTEKNKVMVELYDLPITERKDDRFGRVVTSKSLNEDDLIKTAVARRTDLNATTLKASIEILKQIAIEEVCNGASVAFGLGFFGLKVNGVFTGDNAQWDSTKHSLGVRVIPNVNLRKAVETTGVNIRGLAVSGTVINSVTDVASGEENGTLTPGGGVNLTGTRIRIEGENPSVGLKLVNMETDAETAIPATSILTNDPSRVTFIVPADLPEGDYQLVLTTQFSGVKTPLKEPRSYEFGYPLNV
ncbi:DUF4469 domain-containing protein [Proteiniphilum sp.]|uniref:DUF4469 domain-containing protein n=1 Tax=Proteiniphilum sp. TaxID=1926877 RepID=UPI0033336D3E